MDPSKMSDKDWKKQLPDESFRVCRLKGTEQPGSGKFLNHWEKGTYKCICCKVPLFRSEDKFEFCGWPSFSQAYGTSADGDETNTNIKREDDSSHGMQRTEVVCKQCNSHLGHVFPDGPPPFNRRFCINSVSLEFEKDD